MATRPSRPLTIYAFFMCALLLIVARSLADEPSVPAPETKKDPKEAKSEDRLAAEQLIAEIEVETLVDDRWLKVNRIPEPLLLYGDLTRDNDRGSVWAWGEKGRPVALLELFQDVSDRTKWTFALCNTSGGKIRATRRGATWWQENESASELKDLPGTPVPAGDTPQRQRQIKLLSQKFTGHQFWDPNNTRYALRRLERPLHTYRDISTGVLEGGLFTLANGTNPEIMLFIEARIDPNDKTKSIWQYTVGRLAHAELHLEYDGKEVFTAPRGQEVSGPNRPYWLGFLRSSAILAKEPD